MEYTIGQFAKKINRSVETLRDWERKDLLVPGRRQKGKRSDRYYTEAHYSKAIELISGNPIQPLTLQQKVEKAIALLEEIKSELS